MQPPARSVLKRVPANAAPCERSASGPGLSPGPLRVYEPSVKACTDRVDIYGVGLELDRKDTRVRYAPTRGRRNEEGFTLIELMVVVLIIAILMAIAVPTFLGARQRAQNTHARADLRNAMTAAQVHYTETEDYQILTVARLESIEPKLDYSDVVGNADYDTISFADAGPSQIVMVRQSRAGDYFCVAVGAGATQFGRADAVASVDTVPECNGGWD